MRRAVHGLSVVELLISAALLVVLLSALGGLYISTNRAYRTNQEVTAASSQLRSAIEAIQRDVGQAGFTGRDITSMDGIAPLSVRVGGDSCLSNDEICPQHLQALTVHYVEDADSGGHTQVTYSVEDEFLLREVNGDEQALAEGILGVDLVSYVTANGSTVRGHLAAPTDYAGVTLRVRYMQSGESRSSQFTAVAQ